jgi:hypothetical protein
LITISTNKLQGDNEGTVEVEEGVKLITTNKLQGDNEGTVEVEEGVKLYQAMN